MKEEVGFAFYYTQAKETCRGLPGDTSGNRQEVGVGNSELKKVPAACGRTMQLRAMDALGEVTWEEGQAET